jgi:RND family efflux transporter MFP subunit
MVQKTHANGSLTIEPSAPRIGAPTPVEGPAIQAHSIVSEVPARVAEWRGRRVVGLVALAIAGLAVLFAVGIYPRLQNDKSLNDAATAKAAAAPRVTVVKAKLAPSATERVLPGDTLPLQETSLYARTTGYLKSRLVDRGDRVQEGQLLADISAPDVDDQLAQARANLALAKANLRLAQANADLAKITLNRDIKSGMAVSPEQIDQDRANVQTTAAQVASAEASIMVNESTVQRFVDLQSFQKITAPFSGVITARAENLERGFLVSADSPNTTRELLHIMRTDVLRVMVNVPQAFALSIKKDQDAIVFFRDQPKIKFSGKVTRTADALDSNTRTLLTEVQVQNPEDALRPGMYVQVKFVFSAQTVPVLVPTASVVTRADGSKVGVLDERNAVHYLPVKLGRDYGAEVEVVDGLQGSETVIVRPGDDLPEGTTVEPVTPQAAK